ncbi:hypothetical protein [Kitasatospora sp. NPDC059673]|uniref:hypothetical protein n=1 Tax=Kitasatospora sp. NPDC059673 TaxID=3346901 RepID=UPI00368EF532
MRLPIPPSAHTTEQIAVEPDFRSMQACPPGSVCSWVDHVREPGLFAFALRFAVRVAGIGIRLANRPIGAVTDGKATMNEASPDSVDMPQGRSELGRILGLDGPVPEGMWTAALADEDYARALLTCRDPTRLQHLLRHPPSVPGSDLSAAALIAHGAKALARWGRAGFVEVDEETRLRRLAVCGHCPHLRPGPQGKGTALLQTVAGLGLRDKSVCGLCGCLLARKSRLPSESCPAPHPTEPGLTRWGEPTPVVTPPPPRAASRKGTNKGKGRRAAPDS